MYEVSGKMLCVYHLIYRVPRERCNELDGSGGAAVWSKYERVIQVAQLCGGIVCASLTDL